jgi:hypothetical protein
LWVEWEKKNWKVLRNQYKTCTWKLISNNLFKCLLLEDLADMGKLTGNSSETGCLDVLGEEGLQGVNLF